MFPVKLSDPFNLFAHHDQWVQIMQILHGVQPLHHRKAPRCRTPAEALHVLRTWDSCARGCEWVRSAVLKILQQNDTVLFYKKYFQRMSSNFILYPHGGRTTRAMCSSNMQSPVKLKQRVQNLWPLYAINHSQFKVQNYIYSNTENIHFLNLWAFRPVLLQRIMSCESWTFNPTVDFYHEWGLSDLLLTLHFHPCQCPHEKPQK